MTDAEAREMARELVRGSIVEDAVSQFIAQIIKHTHDERVKPLRKQVANLEAKLAKAVEAVDKAAALIEERHVVYMTAKGRNPKDYISEWSLIAKEVRAMLVEIKGESQDGMV